MQQYIFNALSLCKTQVQADHFMSNLGFSQLVSGSTHDKGGTIDQVYVNMTLKDNASVIKTRVPFSDHDQIRVILKDF